MYGMDWSQTGGRTGIDARLKSRLRVSLVAVGEAQGLLSSMCKRLPVLLLVNRFYPNVFSSHFWISRLEISPPLGTKALIELSIGNNK